jgi:hypothetical protein
MCHPTRVTVKVMVTVAHRGDASIARANPILDRSERGKLQGPAA